MNRARSQSPESRPVGESGAAEPEDEAVPNGPLDAERDFYEGYPWCLNPYPTIRETVEHLGVELDRLSKAPPHWQVAEVMTNVYLLSCAVLNSVDEYLRGATFKLPRKAPAVPFSRRILRAAEKLAALVRWPRRARVRRWRDNWQPRFDAFLSIFVAEAPPAPTALADAGKNLAVLLRAPLPADLQAEHIYFPSAFRKHDLTHFDVLTMGRRFATHFPDRRQPILILGLRTAGSYFGPLLRAFLNAEGYQTVDVVTVRPDKGLGTWERAEMTRRARAGYLVAIFDDAPGSGDTLALAVDLARKAGFASDRTAVLVPVHPANRDWRRHVQSLSLSDAVVLDLQSEEWHKQRLLDPKWVERRLAEYFQGRGYSSASLVAGATADQFNARLHGVSEDARRARLKRIYEVRLQTPEGRVETRYVLAKSVGWGWLGYHAFLAGRRLARFVPPLLGLRDGILYTEWLPQPAAADSEPEDRGRWIRTIASYVAARACSLKLEKNPLPSLGLHQHHDGFGLLDKVLSRAYGGSAAGLMRPRVRHRLSSQPCPHPTLIDGKMQRSEWITGPHGLLKTDYEHHGMGKNELNVLDPAYDLAEAVLHLELSSEEERELVRRYAAESGDAGVARRLFMNKILAGSWAMSSALKNLFRHPQLTDRRQEFHRHFVRAWNFLTTHTARFCGDLCRPPKYPCWRSPLVVLDIDGVLDRRIFGFPCTTAAGVQALFLLHAHEFAVAVDTARSAAEVREYCRAYGFVGGVAEYGSYLWDAVAQRGRVLVSTESLSQLDKLRKALEQLPGVFLNDGYQYSLRAYTYEDKSPAQSRALTPYDLSSIRTYTCEDKSPTPLPTLMVQQLMAAPGLDRLCFHQTGSDTTIVAREVDKGAGLTALLNWVGRPDVEAWAVGDSEPDLAMFRVATRSFAPAQINCSRQARLLGCQIARHPYQRGLLSIVRSLVHPGGGRCQRCSSAEGPRPGTQDLFLDLLQAADRKRSAALLRALLDPKTYQVFVR